ncbi:S23 ribosomal protein [Thermoanaerobacter pseudethanolicus ATCC 33223]|uniref:S23 ribosomal protein n=1 Tax=Thermoanaerobacter pseudethanolicus (strain ATCC 33223 / 39E) TaxID=340099 RepID=B0K7W4_THEP3|nr:S23 ribosomal protein [Thermoanaerobacter sp. X514]ABY94079.1 S23 ribosomal protein [Thermoanaerobacter pseudethanolicus ATCC 33223]ABY92205.1 S23 ribosomal protein [Thermoanaerobacter sp. X514]ABY93059.1 S23 ribosomal protein [Thermoanaerobacter sp. X514]ABY93091.1 S23 ribosomal protein [Thermoanaerobacter sp. X514]
MIKTYKDLRIYQQSYKLSIEIHKLTQNYPGYERYELGSQLRRAATSIPLNIAEGYGKKESEADFKRYLKIALGSSNEIEVLLDLSYDLGYIDKTLHNELIEEYTALRKQIYTMIKKWRVSDI